MKSNDLAELATRNLRESRLRNSLTTLGIAVGVASLVAMLSLGIGLQQMANRRLEKSGLFDTIVVTSRRELRGGERLERRNALPPAESRTLDENARLEIEKYPNVLEAAPDIRFVTEFNYGSKPHMTMVAALPLTARDKDAFDNMQGRFFSSGTAHEAILQQEFAEELLGITQAPTDDNGAPKPDAATQALVGKDLVLHYAERSAGPGGGPASAAAPGQGATPSSFSVMLRETTLKIVGITDQDAEGLRAGGRARVFIPLEFAQNLHLMLPTDLRDATRSFSNVPIYGALGVRVKDPNHVETVQNAIKKMGFNTFSILDATRSLRRFFTVLDLFLGIFGSLALAVASLGIVNTLVMAILERRREIGIMKAIGASDGDVKTLFFAEAGVMGAFGGALGVLLGWAIGRAINAGTNIYLHQQQLPSENIWSVPWWLVLGAIGFAIVVSMLSGLYPAARAARLDPVKALRYE